VIACLLLSLLLLGPTNISGLLPNETKLISKDISTDSQCVEYESAQKLIHVRCKSIHLTDIHNHLDNPNILGIENNNDGPLSSFKNEKVWILDAGIVVEKEGGLIIDSSDTSWLKITSTPTLQPKQVSDNVTDKEDSDDSSPQEQTPIETDTQNINTSNTEGNDMIVVSKNNGNNPNGIHVHGSLKIDSVKITSWDPEKKDVIKFDYGKRPGEEHTKSDYDTAEPRAFIRISKEATGTTNITNSELAYLGYSCSRCSGLSYYGGEGSVIKDNNIHHLLKGFYSKNAGYLTVDSNKFHDNYLYGIDPHTGSHDLAISDNLVYNNNASGIICSKHCYNILIEGNDVYNNVGAGGGIVFSINTTKSVAKNNNVHDQPRCISFSRSSDHNAVYNNTISNCKIGVYLGNTNSNSIYDNKIDGTENAIFIQNVGNMIYNNKITEAENGIVFEPVSRSNRTNDIASVNSVTTDNDNNSYLINIVDENHILDTKNPIFLKKQPLNNSAEVEPDEKKSTRDPDN
jgi:mannuronan 5-epimerase